MKKQPPVFLVLIGIIVIIFAIVLWKAKQEEKEVSVPSEIETIQYQELPDFPTYPPAKRGEDKG